MLPQNNEQISSISNEVPQQNETAPAETGTSTLRGEIGAEKIQTPTPQQKDDDSQPLLVKTATVKKDENIVNKTNTKTELHHVAENADKLTTIADKDEEEFIGGVETAHHATK